MTDRSGDGTRVSPIVARRQLHALFVQARRDAGFASREPAAQALGWSPRKQALLETDEQRISVRDVERSVRVFGIPGDEWATWYQLAELAQSDGWWDAYDDADLSAEGKRFAGLEWGARRLRTFDGSIMPPLLQIPGYTAAALDAGLVDRPPEQVHRLLAVRRQRQRVLGNPDPLEYHAILDEAALRRRGGDDVTMSAQLHHLVDLASTRPNVTVQVVPFTAGLYAGQSGTFVILELDQSGPDPGTVHIEPGFAGAYYLDSRADLYLYSRVFQRLVDVALGPEASLDLISSFASRT